MANGILHNPSGDNFGVKADMLGLSIEKQVEQLNRIYKDQAIFDIVRGTDFNTDEQYEGISVAEILGEYHQFVLPSTSMYYIDRMIDLSVAHKLSSVVVPSCVNRIEFRNCNWVTYIDRLFVYDTTDLDFSGFSKHSLDKLSMVIVRPLKTLSKPRIYRL